LKVACVGGGPAGLYFALLMKRHNPENDITVFERKSIESSYGWGITFGEEVMEKLYSADPESAGEIEKATSPFAGEVVAVDGKQATRSWHGGYSLNRQRMLSVLADRAEELGVHLRLGREVTALSQLPEADLVVACDGANSRIRQEAGFRTHVRLGRNKYAWLGSDKVFEPFTFMFVCTEFGWLTAWAYGLDANVSTFIVECSAETWTGLGFDAMSADSTLSSLAKIFEHHLDGHKLIGLGPDGSEVRWSSFRTITNQNWHAGKIVLVGDAAHTTSWTIGSGTKLAIEDAIVLTESLRHGGDVESALSSYEKQRKAALAVFQNAAYYSARWMENMPRYVGLQPREFAMLLEWRANPLLPYLPPRLCYRLIRAAEGPGRALRRPLAAQLKAIYKRR
jgi:2-polyprenyl-6-methoxyphenol hydroxylase-like FAD-dependent oxidoreductase